MRQHDEDKPSDEVDESIEPEDLHKKQCMLLKIGKFGDFIIELYYFSEHFRNTK